MSEKLARWLPLALLAGLALGSVSPRAGAQLLECNAASVAELASSMAAHNEHVERMERKFVDIWYFQGRLPGGAVPKVDLATVYRFLDELAPRRRAAESLRAELRDARGVRDEGVNRRPVPKRGVVIARPAGAPPVLEPIVVRLSRLLVPDPIADALLWESIETCRRTGRCSARCGGHATRAKTRPTGPASPCSGCREASLVAERPQANARRAEAPAEQMTARR